MPVKEHGYRSIESLFGLAETLVPAIRVFGPTISIKGGRVSVGGRRRSGRSIKIGRLPMPEVSMPTACRGVAANLAKKTNGKAILARRRVSMVMSTMLA